MVKLNSTKKMVSLDNVMALNNVWHLLLVKENNGGKDEDPDLEGYNLAKCKAISVDHAAVKFEDIFRDVYAAGLAEAVKALMWPKESVLRFENVQSDPREVCEGVWAITVTGKIAAKACEAYGWPSPSSVANLDGFMRYCRNFLIMTEAAYREIIDFADEVKDYGGPWGVPMCEHMLSEKESPLATETVDFEEFESRVPDFEEFWDGSEPGDESYPDEEEQSQKDGIGV